MKIKLTVFLIGVLTIVVAGFVAFSRYHYYNSLKIGQAIDSLNSVKVYYNGSISNVCGRSVTDDHYNLGKKYQCVEFVKRYYYEYLGHKMPDSYGHARDFFDAGAKDGMLNKRRNLKQYRNPSTTKPKVNDLVIFSGSYGHVAIISKVMKHRIEIIQQNPGPFVSSRATFRLKHSAGKWQIRNKRILGWLRKES